MDNLPLADRLRPIWFEAALDGWPEFMLAALIDAAGILERSAPPAQRGPERGAKSEARGGEEPRGPTVRRAGGGEHGWGAQKARGVAMASDSPAGSGTEVTESGTPAG